MKIHPNSFIGTKFTIPGRNNEIWKIGPPREIDGYFSLYHSMRYSNYFSPNGEWWSKHDILNNFKNGTWIKI